MANEKTTRIPLGTSVISVKTGTRFVYLKRLNKKTHRVITASAFKSACETLQDEATKNPMAVKGSPMAYVSKSDIQMFDKADIITEDAYKEAINTPENKIVLTDLKKLETKQKGLFNELKTVEKDMAKLNHKLFSSIK